MRKSSQSLSRSIVVSLSLLTCMVLWQNCGEVALMPKVKQDPTGGAQSPESNPSHLVIPEAPDMELRAVFIVDMSSSTTLMECAESVDMTYNEDSLYTSNPPQYSFKPCDQRFGSDPKMLRLQAMDKWMQEIRSYLQNKGLPESKFKAILIPFAGIPATGASAHDISTVNPTVSGRVLNLNRRSFVGINEIAKTIEDLKILSLSLPDPDNFGITPEMYQDYGINDQMTSLVQAANPHSINLMTTSVPGKKIEDASTIILNELRALQIRKNNGEITDARFEVVFLSDGIPKPRKDHVKKAISMLWDTKQIHRNAGCWQRNNCEFDTLDFTSNGLQCFERCKQQVASLIDTGIMPEHSTGSCPRQCLEVVLDYRSTPSADGNNTTNYPPESLLETVKEYWGDYAANDIIRILLKVRVLESAFDNYPWVSFRFNFFRVQNPDPRLRYWFLDYIPEGNWMLKAREVFMANHRHVDLVSRDVPSLFPGMGPAEAYRLSFLYAMNMNVRVNTLGVLEPDSDADGLTDYEEEQLQGFDPRQARSDNLCLDVIRFRMNACESVGCLVEVDKDGDGLNECEERTLGTNDFDVDTDGDGIIDSHEILFGLSPLVNDSDEDNDGNGDSNLKNFRVGLGPWLDMNSVTPSFLTRLHVRMAGDKAVTLPDGSTALVPLYTLQLKSIPSMGTLGSEKNLSMYSNKARTPDLLRDPQTLDFDLQTGHNKIQFFGRVDNSVNTGDRFWIHYSTDVLFTGSQMLLNIQLSDFESMDWSDPLEIR